LATLVVQRADLSADWSAAPADNSSDDSSAELAKCIGVRDTTPDQIDSVDSPDFTLQGAQISSNATTYRSQSDIDTDVALIKNPKTQACFQTIARQQLAGDPGSGVVIKSLSLKIQPHTAAMPANMVGELSVTAQATSDGKPVTVYIDTYLITGRLIEAEVDFTSSGAAIPAAYKLALASRVAARVAKA
jgi:hypothetical protein